MYSLLPGNVSINAHHMVSQDDNALFSGVSTTKNVLGWVSPLWIEFWVIFSSYFICFSTLLMRLPKLWRNIFCQYIKNIFFPKVIVITTTQKCSLFDVWPKRLLKQTVYIRIRYICLWVTYFCFSRIYKSGY